MHRNIRLILCLIAINAPNAAYATKLSHKEYERFSGAALPADSNKVLYVRKAEDNNYWLNIVQGLLNSTQGDIGQYIAEVPCNDINTLTTDAAAAEQFVQQIEQGQVPTLITNLPQDAVNEFSNIINILTSLPSEVINVAEAAVTDVVSIVDDIEDGHITAVIASLPSDIVHEITEGWDDLTNGLTDAWNALTHGVECVILDKCPKTPVDTCGTPLTGTATTAAAPTLTPIPASTAGQQPSPTGIYNQSTPLNGTQYGSLASKSFEWAARSLLGIAAAGILGVSILL